MAIWFPALRASLEKRLGPYLPPHPMRSLTGAALAALLFWTVGGAVYVVGVGVAHLWQGATYVASSVGEVLQTVPHGNQTQVVSQPLGAGDPQASDVPHGADVPNPKPEPEPKPGERQPIPPMSAEAMGVRTPKALPEIKGTPTVRAPVESFELPYAEGEDIALADAARQADYALSQTFLRLGMDLSRLEILQSETRHAPATTPSKSTDSNAAGMNTATATTAPYMFQRLRVHLAGTVEDFVAALENSREAWAEGAILEQTTRNGRTVLNVSTKGVPTHEIFLRPAGAVFVPPPRLGEPRLSIVIDDMGADLTALRELMALDLPITFSVLPYTAHARETAEAAAAAGHEVLLHQPMEPMQAPYVSPGPNALKTGMKPEEQRTILRRNFALLPQAVGLNNHMGSRATRDRALCRLVAEEAALSGLFVLDSLTIPSSIFQEEARAAHLTAYRRDFFLDDGNPGRRAILNILKQAEQSALRSGQAIVIGHPRADTIAALKEWVHQRNADVAVVPLRYQ